jgi:hypothetical protein
MRRLLMVVVVAMLVSLAGARADVNEIATPAANRLTDLNAGFSPYAVRLVMTVDGSTAPTYQVYYRATDNSIVIDVRDIAADNVRMPHLPSDPLVHRWDLERPDFRTAQWVLKLGYAIPTDHIHSTLLQSPTRIVVDLDRNFQENLTLPVTQHVTWTRHEVRAGSGYYLLNELEVAQTQPGVGLRLITPDSGQAVEKPTDMATRQHALALINGGFFSHSAGALGLVVQNGRLVRPNVGTRPPRTALGITPDGRIMMSRVEVKDNVLHTLDGQVWNNVALALGGGPRLVKDGQVAVDAEAEALGRGGNDITEPASRTAVAQLANGHLLLVTVSSGHEHHGWSLTELAQWLVRRGAVQAMGFDGGGSTAMVLQGALISHPSWSHFERSVGDALAVDDAAPSLLPAAVQVQAAQHDVPANGSAIVTVTARVTDRNGQPVPDGQKVFFSTTSGMINPSAVTRGGVAQANWIPLHQAADSHVVAYAGLVWGEDVIHVAPGAPQVVAGRLLPVVAAPMPVNVIPSPSTSVEPGGPAGLYTPAAPSPSPSGRTYMLEALVFDVYKNALPHQDVEVRVGSQVEHAQTGADGVARLRIEVPPGISTVTLASSGVSPMQLVLPNN